MRKIITYALSLGLAFSGTDVLAQTVTGQGFEGTTFPPAGWQAIGGGFGAPTWSRRTIANAGTTPACTPFGGSAMARFSARGATPGRTQTLGSPVIDLSKRGTANSYISLYVFRDTIYNTDDSVAVWFNTARNLTGAKRLGGITRYAKKTYPDSVAQGWYKYSFAIPASYTGTTNYFLIQGTARGGANGGNLFIDSVTWDAYPTFCEGKPDAGKLSASVYYICGTAGPSTITLANNTASTGISLRYELSTDSSTFTTNAWTANVNTANFGAAIGTYRYIRAIVSCSRSGQTDTSNCIRLWIDNTATAPVITVTPANAAVCAGATTGVKLVASGASTYSWTPTTGLSSSTGDTIYSLPAASTFYTVSGVDDNGCTGQRNVFVQIQNGPNVNLTATDTSVCEGDSVQLTASVVAGGGPPQTYTYSWSTGSTTSTTFAKANGATSSYQVSVKNAAGCETIKSKTLYGVLKPKASYKVTSLGGRKVQFEFTGSNAADVYWNYSDGNESFQPKPTYTFSADGTFKVMLVANNPPCKSDTMYFDVKVTNVGTRAQSLMNLSMMPNPASDLVLVKFNGVEAKLIVVLIDAMGREVYTQNFSSVNGAQGLVIPTTQLSEGLYQVRIKSKDGVSSLGLQVSH